MTEHENPWQDARDTFENKIIPKLTRIGLQVGKDANDGNKFASEIMRLYTMLHKSFDPLSLIFLEEAIKDYEKNGSNLE